MYPAECDCSCDTDGTGGVSEALWPRARWAHYCIECNGVIKQGERYENHSGCYDGHWYHAKTCLSCTRIRKQFCPHGSVSGELAEQIKACRGFDYRDDPANWDQAEVDAEDLANREYWRKRKEANAHA